MRGIIGIAIVVLLCFAGVSSAEETLAIPKHRLPPEYPATCRPTTENEATPQSVTLFYGVTRNGETKNVRVLSSTDACFEEAAIAAVRGWTYEPRRVDGARTSQEDLEVTITFLFDQETQTEEYDAEPLVRVPPRYPERCMRGADRSEQVMVEFDVTVDGVTENIRVIESSNACLEKSAVESVAKWRYRPKTTAGKPVVRRGVQTVLIFNLHDGFPPRDQRLRRAVRGRLLRAKRLIKRDRSQEALKVLEEIEVEYGDSFSRVELGSFHRLRSAARINTGDYKGALDDLYVVQRSGFMTEEIGEAIGNMIEHLEAAIAAQEPKSDAEPEVDETTVSEAEESPAE